MRFKALSVTKGTERWKVLEFASLQNFRSYYSGNEYSVTAVLCDMCVPLLPHYLFVVSLVPNEKVTCNARGARCTHLLSRFHDAGLAIQFDYSHNVRDFIRQI